MDQLRLAITHRTIVLVLTLSWFVAALPASESSTKLQARQVAANESDEGSALFKEQMRNPSEVFSVVLLIGGDIVQTAIAQMTGDRVTLVAFSFGWVAYAFNTLRSAFGDGTFMPPPEYSSIVINAKSGVRKTNESWLIGRLIRDLEQRTEEKFDSWPGTDNGKPIKDGEGNSALLVTTFEAAPGAGHPEKDLCFLSFFGVILGQLAVAAVPVILRRNWSIMFITAAGTVLAVLTGSVREWRLEKYKARSEAKHPYIITRGNGHKHVFIIFNKSGTGLQLDDLAGAVQTAGPITRLASVFLAILWTMFLVTAGGIDEDSWYLLLVGAMGMAQNVVVAGVSRKSSSHGIPLTQIGPVMGRKVKGDRRPKVMDVLYQVEDFGFDRGIKGVGLALRREYFPDWALRDHEVDEWKAKADRVVTKTGK